jgi:hypothetical protein
MKEDLASGYKIMDGQMRSRGVELNAHGAANKQVTNSKVTLVSLDLWVFVVLFSFFVFLQILQFIGQPNHGSAWQTSWTNEFGVY